MAGMEEIEIHSKSYLVRWVNVSDDHTISWSLQPHKKSLNFGIFKHPGGAGPLNSGGASIPPPNNETDDLNKENVKSGSSAFSVTEKLKGIGLRQIQWIGKCEADKIFQGSYDVQPNEGGNYALVIDNTFSKQISKTATFVLLTYPTNSPPRSGHQVHHSQAPTTAIGSNQGSHASPNLKHAATDDSSDSLRHTRNNWGKPTAHNGVKVPPGSSSSSQSFPTPVHTGILQKRRRKRHQGHARRFFTLDFNSSTLSYYHDRNSSALRGSIPLSLAAIATNDNTREISIDSGAEIWHLRALDNHDFGVWKHALEKASKTTKSAQPEAESKPSAQQSQGATLGKVESRTWQDVEQLVSKVSSARDTVRNLAKDTDPKYLASPAEPASHASDRSRSPGVRRGPESSADDSVDSKEKRSFWKMGIGKDARSPVRSHRNISPQTAASPVDSTLAPSAGKEVANGSSRGGVHDQLMDLLHDMNSVVSDFNTLLLEQKHRRPASVAMNQPRLSLESDVSEVFFDATDGNASPLLRMHADSEDEDEGARDKELRSPSGDNESLSGSEVEDSDDDQAPSSFRPDDSSPLFPVKAKSLSPLPLDSVARRTVIAPPKLAPPSLIGFLRRNVGKDLSTISMPVSANEPLSLLQRGAEQFEYSELLDQAAGATDGLERLIYVTAFALSSLSNSRVKERAIRKPFNPMLGETYELVREDKGFRFVAEKVSHRPVQLACQADSKNWSYTQSPKPTQKFWGKSAEIVTEGKARITLHTSGEHFSFSGATCFLRNIIAGEKYVEPVGEMSVLNETTGQKAMATFKAGGMFSGRSEEVDVQTFGPHGEEEPLGLQGNWTSSFQLTKQGNLTNTTIWQAGSLVDRAAKHYGYTSFVATLNEVTSTEKGKIPPTDSRIRPDQRALEDGDLDLAEGLKAQLEEQQRHRRKEMEAAGETWRPRWFTEVDSNGAGDKEGVWKLRTGKEGYWEERARGTWSGVLPVFKL